MSPEYVKDLPRKFWVVIKAATLLFCLAGFVGNSFMIFKQFIGKQTITSQDTQKNEELALPSFTVCALSGFKEKMTKFRDVELDGFHNKSLEFDEYILSVDDMTIEELRENDTTWELSTTYSPYKGRCHTIRYIPKVVEKIDTVSFELVAETEFWIYIHDEGAEYFLHYDYWPRIPAIHQVKLDEVHLDLMVRKNVEHSDETCFSYDESYTYFDCLREAFQETLDEQNLNCTLPWIESMKNKNGVNYTELENPTCNTMDDYHFVDDIGSEFAIDASSFSVSQCLAPCELATYQVGVLSYDALSFITIDEDEEEDNATSSNSTKVCSSKAANNTDSEDYETDYDGSGDTGPGHNITVSNSTEDCIGPEDNTTLTNSTDFDTLSVSLYYSTTDVKVSSTSLKVDFNTFVSNVGGSLGLFIGFSVLGGFYFIYDVLQEKNSFRVWPELSK